MTNPVPPAAVEAARVEAGWESVTHEAMRPIIEAAAPFIRAETWDECWRVAGDYAAALLSGRPFLPEPVNPYRTASSK